MKKQFIKVEKQYRIYTHICICIETEKKREKPVL